MDSLCLRTGFQGIAPSIPINTTIEARTNPPLQFSGPARSPPPTNAISSDNGSVGWKAASRFSFNFPFRSLFPGGRQRMRGVALDDGVLVERKERQLEGGFSGGNCDAGRGSLGDPEGDRQNGNWVLKILRVRSMWALEKKRKGEDADDGEGEMGSRERMENGELGYEEVLSPSSSFSSCDDQGEGGCRVCEYDDDDDDDEKHVVFNRETFSKLLKKVSLADVKLYAHLSYLGNLAYCIPSIKPGNLLKNHDLRYVTSSIEKREQLALASSEKGELLSNAESEETKISSEGRLESTDRKNVGRQISASAAFQIAASAASYLHTHTRSILPFLSSSNDMHQYMPESSIECDEKAKMASLMATTESVTAVVAAEEEVKQAVADDLNSISSSPCEWYTCDDDKSATRFFVIQGSESLASWQANLLFEPVLFEGMDVFVHRGIYEAAKGMYQQMLPEVRAHMKSHGSQAKFRFTGHSLGGSLSLLLNLMLLIRGEVRPSSLLPVITFGAPCIMCGGDELLRKLGLPKSHVQAITMHRDIVPRAFSCSYPDHVAELLKAVNGNFRNHPCLKSQKLLYAPMGEFLILQPDGNFSPPHDLLPSGSGLYLLCCKKADAKEAEKQLRGAKNVFLNMPHPLEILSDRYAYGNGGTVQRDHDMNSYLKCVRGVVRQELNRKRKAERERRRKFWWPLVAPHVAETGVIFGSGGNPYQGELIFATIARTGSKTLKQLSRFVSSKQMNLLILLLLRAKLLLVGNDSMLA